MKPNGRYPQNGLAKSFETVKVKKKRTEDQETVADKRRLKRYNTEMERGVLKAIPEQKDQKEN